ncbi:hypothetical protein [Actinosynnema sp. NPDC023587]|uniref:hypothetical protein n=1 Tax=Actinosynnema sp. NPDC023587 TaxID=3154695 RepID=UPI0033D21DAA
MRTMYDSTRPWEIPAGAEMVAGYVDGRWAWSQEAWDRFRNAIKVRISAVGATHHAEVFDVEPGCIWPPENVVPLVVRARAAGIDPTVYCNRRNHWAGVRAVFDAADVPQPHYWVAEYDGVAEVPAGSVGKQYRAPEASGKAKSPAHYDISSMADYWPGVDEEDNMPSAREIVDELLARPVQLWAGQEVAMVNLLRGAQGYAHTLYDVLVPNGDNFGSPLFTDNPNTEQARTVRLRDFYQELRDGQAASAARESAAQVALERVLVALATQNGGELDVPALLADVRQAAEDGIETGLRDRVVSVDVSVRGPVIDPATGPVAANTLEVPA